MKGSIVGLLLFNFIIFSSQQPPAPAEIDAASKDCAKTTNVDPKIQEKLYLRGEFTDDKNLKCFIKCMAVKLGGMTETGEILVEDLKTKFTAAGIPQDKINSVVAKCKDVTGADPCEKAYNMAKCIVEPKA